MVDVEGSVQEPRVYHLSNDARIQYALLAAGGLSDDADKNEMQHSLNLVAKVTDRMKIYIPYIGEESSKGTTNITSTRGEAEGGGSQYYRTYQYK